MYVYIQLLNIHKYRYYLQYILYQFTTHDDIDVVMVHQEVH